MLEPWKQLPRVFPNVQTWGRWWSQKVTEVIGYDENVDEWHASYMIDDQPMVMLGYFETRTAAENAFLAVRGKYPS